MLNNIKSMKKSIKQYFVGKRKAAAKIYICMYEMLIYSISSKKQGEVVASLREIMALV